LEPLITNGKSERVRDNAAGAIGRALMSSIGASIPLDALLPPLLAGTLFLRYTSCCFVVDVHCIFV
jgi:hypothetical protein